MTAVISGRCSASALIALCVAVVVFAGCASQPATTTANVEARIENTGNRADHEGLASWYEGQAALNASTAKRHQGYAAIYRRNTSPQSDPLAHLALALHCENLARTYQQAADQNLALAKLHRELAGQAR